MKWNNRMQQNGRKRGFTLIELLVVILILAILAAMIVPRYFTRVDEAKRSRALSDIQNVSKLLQVFRTDTGRYPTTEEGLEALRTQPADVTDWRGPYTVNPIPNDPWGSPYNYEFLGDDTFALYSFGADGVEGGEGNDADIIEGID